MNFDMRTRARRIVRQRVQYRLPSACLQGTFTTRTAAGEGVCLWICCPYIYNQEKCKAHMSEARYVTFARFDA